MNRHLSVLAGLALAGLVAASSTARSEETEGKRERTLPEMPRSLDAMLAVALRANPDLLAAEAAVREAQAKLNQARLKVIEGVLTEYHEREKQEALLKGHKTSLQELKQRIAVGQAVSSETVLAEIAIAEARARMAQNDARLRYLLGAGGDAGLAAAEKAASGVQPAPARARPPLPEKYRQLLDKKVSVDFGGLALDQALKDKLTELFGEQVRISAFVSLPRFQVPVRDSFQDASLRDVVQFLNDFFGITLLFRDYGILATTGEDAIRIYAPAFPVETPYGVK